MNPRQALSLLAATLLAASARAESECGGPLTEPAAFEVPASTDLERRAPEIFEQMRELMSRDANVVGSNNAMVVLNGQIRPTLDAVALYLTSPDNAGAMRPHEATRLAAELLKDLNDRLDVLKGKFADGTSPTRWNWMTLRHEPRTRSVEDQALRIRYLRFALDAAVAKIERDARAWPDALHRATALSARLGEVEALLAQIESRLDVGTEDWTFKLRVKNLIDDVRNQGMMLAGARSAIEQKIYLANALLDDARTLVLVRFSAEAMMGDQPLDLSPLEPPKVESSAPAAASVTPADPELREAIRAIKRTVNDADKKQTKREMLQKFMEANARRLNPSQAIDVATCTWSTTTDDIILQLYVRLRWADLTQTQILEIASHCKNDEARKNVVSYIDKRPAVPLQPPERFGVLR